MLITMGFGKGKFSFIIYGFGYFEEILFKIKTFHQRINKREFLKRRLKENLYFAFLKNKKKYERQLEKQKILYLKYKRYRQKLRNIKYG